MVELVSFNSGELSLELVNDKLICFIPVIVVENDGVTQMHSIRKQIRNRENVLDSRLHSGIYIFARHYS
jgi:hypothetical protein